MSANGSLSLPDQYWPMPDVMVLRPSENEYEDAHPTHDDALVVIEVSDSSVGYDRNVKYSRCAEAGIPEYWLVDLTRDVITIHQHPAAGVYQGVQTYGAGAFWTSSAIEGLTVPVDAILRRR